MFVIEHLEQFCQDHPEFFGDNTRECVIAEAKNRANEEGVLMSAEAESLLGPTLAFQFFSEMTSTSKHLQISMEVAERLRKSVR